MNINVCCKEQVHKLAAGVMWYSNVFHDVGFTLLKVLLLLRLSPYQYHITCNSSATHDRCCRVIQNKTAAFYVLLNNYLVRFAFNNELSTYINLENITDLLKFRLWSTYDACTLHSSRYLNDISYSQNLQNN